MAKVEFTPYILRETADIYSFRIEGEKESEFGKFLVMFKDIKNPYLLDDFNKNLSRRYVAKRMCGNSSKNR